MAQDPNKPLDDGRVRLPSVSAGMDRVAPNSLHDDDKKVQFLRDKDKKSAEGDQAILARMRKRLDRCISAEADNRRDGLDDDKFYAGDQWDANTRSKRTAKKRPCQTINRLPVLVKQVTNDQRQNRPTIDIHPVGDRGDVGVAQIYRDLIRHIERESHADTAYDTGFESAARKGWGYWRITTEFESSDTFDQVLCVRRILNAYSVYIDPDAVEADASDSSFDFITEMVDRDEFKEKWPTADPMPWPSGGFGDAFRNWGDQYSLRIAEYYEVTHEKRELVMLSNGFEGWLDELGEDAKQQFSIVQRRTVHVPKVMWYKATAVEILERTEWLGQWIPIVRCVGDEMIIEGKVKYWGLVRFAKDPQRMYNYFRPLSLDTSVPTPSGWTTIQDINIGDVVFDESGTPCNVVGQSPIYLRRRCLRVRFDNGDYIVADAEHPWRVLSKGRNAAGLVWTSKELRTDELIANEHYIAQARPLCLPESELPLHPYLLGAWLGNGDSAEPRMTYNETDVEETKDRIRALGYTCGVTQRSGSAKAFSVLNVRHIFTSMGLLGNKHIPEYYLRASESQRWQLLQGLMDTDGTINSKTRQCAFATTNMKISDGIMELLYSLGIHGRIVRKEAYSMLSSNGKTYECSPAHQISFSCPYWEEVFCLARKRAVQMEARPTHTARTKRPHKIIAVDEFISVPVKCITVDSESHLFLAGRSMIPTHNSAETERIMLVPKAPYIGAEGQFEGYEGMWKEANNESFPYLPYKVTEIHGHLVPPPQRQPPVEVPAGIANAAQEASQDMLSATGIRFDATLNERTYDESGKALRELRRSGDIGSFHLIDNCMQAKRRTGEILVDLIPKIYSRPGRVVTILRKDDTEEQIRINPAGPPVQEQTNPATQSVMRAFDPTYGHYGVTVTIGPSYATKRIETADSMMDFLRALPNAAPLIADLVAKNQDWEGAEEIATRLAKTLPPGLNAPELRDIPPQVQALLAQLQTQIQMLTAERQQLQAAVADRNADRQLARDRINRTFEVGLLNVVQKAQASAAKLQAENEQHGAKLAHDLAANVLDLYSELTKATEQTATSNSTPSQPAPAPIEQPRSGAALGPPVAGARQAPDGQWYLADPSRPGKYLRVASNA